MKKIVYGLFSFLFFLFLGSISVSAAGLGATYQNISVVEFTYDFIDITDANHDYKTIQTFYDIEGFDGIRVEYYGTCKTDEFDAYQYTYDLDSGIVTNTSINNQYTSTQKDCSDKTASKSYRSLKIVSSSKRYALSIEQLIELTKNINLSNIINEYSTYENELFDFTSLMFMIDYYDGSQYTYRTFQSFVKKINDFEFRILYSYSNGEETYLGYSQEDLNSAYESGKNSVDITSDNEGIYNQGFTDGQTSVDITSNDEQIWNEAYQEGLDDGYTLGFEDGKDSIDLEEIKKAEYDRGYNNGYNVGFVEGESSVDITSDNDTIIDAYITINKYHTDYEFNLNYEKGYSDGITFVYNNVENDKVITKYVKDYIYINNYRTNTEYIDNYDLGYKDGYNGGYTLGYNTGLKDGKEVVYQNIESDPIVKEYWKTKLMNGTTINITNEGDEIVKIVKNYDVNHNSDDDLIINIHQGQDTYHVETIEEVVPGTSTTTKNNQSVVDYELVYKILGICGAALIGTLGIAILISFLLFLFKPTKKVGTKRKVRNGYVWSH